MSDEKTFVVKDYKDFTEQERRQHGFYWVIILNRHCPADEEGCRPCDYGVPCDRCHYDWDIQREFAQLLVSEGAPLTPDLKRHLTDE